MSNDLDPEELEESFTEVGAQVLDLLAERGETVAVAESLTGGMVAADITAAPGSSQAFRGSVTAYATDLKQELLGVDGALLDERGAVAPDVARSMAEGVQKALRASWGLSTTGVAGPEPQDGQPVGLVFVAAAGPRGTVCHRLQLEGDRGEIRQQTVEAVLALLRELLRGGPAEERTEEG